MYPIIWIVAVQTARICMKEWELHMSHFPGHQHLNSREISSFESHVLGLFSSVMGNMADSLHKYCSSTEIEGSLPLPPWYISIGEPLKAFFVHQVHQLTGTSSENTSSPWIKGATMDIPVATNAIVRMERYLHVWPWSLGWISVMMVNVPQVDPRRLFKCWPMKALSAPITSPAIEKAQHTGTN